MTHSEIFKDIFGLYATEVWSMPESEFWNWLNEESGYNDKKYQNTSLKTDRDGVSEKDMIYRQAAIAVADSSDYVELSVDDVKKVTDEVVKGLKQLPSAQPEIIRCKDCRFNDGVAYCEMHYRDVNGNDFCSWAERRMNG